MHHTMLDTYRGSSLRTLSPLENQVSKVFTKYDFQKIQLQFEMATQYKICEENRNIITMQYYDKTNSQSPWDGILANWSCKNGESFVVMF